MLSKIPEWNSDLSKQAELPVLSGDQWKGGFSIKMLLDAVAKYGYAFNPILKEKEARRNIAVSYWRGGRFQIQAPPIADWQIQFLKNKFNDITGLIATLYKPKLDTGKSIPELIKKFGLEDIDELLKATSSNEGNSTYKKVYLPDGIGKGELRIPTVVRYLVRKVAGLRNRKPTELQLSLVTQKVFTERSIPSVREPFGVNLFGYAKGELGIGEDVRMIAKALDLNNIPFCIINIKLGKNISQADESFSHRLVDKPLYGINIFCQTGIEMSRYVCKEGLGAFRDRYTIGFWPWELPHWPQSCEHSYACVDEIWGISRYTTESYHSFTRTVKKMGLPVDIDGIGHEERHHFNLPEKAYLFGFSFDIHSRTHRKNPQGIIQAFQKAFPNEGTEEVGLVLKVNHPKTWCFDWMKIRHFASRDPRIHIIEQSMRRSSVLALYNTFDCFVSLHRSEGFGRGIAEAILLKKQVITTGFSGNMDFCNESRVALVRSKIKTIKKNEYFWSEGQQWAEPDIEHAVELMRDIRIHPRDTSCVNNNSMPKNCGERYNQRFNEIYKQYYTN